MDSSTACYELREPGVIDETMIYNTIIEQGPKGEEGRLYKEQGIDYTEVTYLRLEFLEILKIDHLWMLTSLTKLQLCNNIIEEIENLEMLTELRELDLSFNNIEKIKNLESLKKLEVLTLFENKIEVIENLDNLINLTILSIGNNKISNFKDVLYLRGFGSLKSLNLAGNPICEDENFVNLVIAYLPQLIYYEYRMIEDGQRKEAVELYQSDLRKLKREEDKLMEIELIRKEAEEQEKINAEAFVEGLAHDELFLMMYENDTDGKTILQMGGSVTDLYTEYKKNFCEVTKEILNLGLEQADLRRKEMKDFGISVTKAKEAAYAESRIIMEEFLEQKTVLFNQMRVILENMEDDDETIAELASEVQAINETFQELCQRTWNILMKKELHFFEACEEVNGAYERNLSELVNQFIEGAQGLFTQLRQLQNAFNENIIDLANRFFTLYTVAAAGGTPLSKEMGQISKELINMLQDRELIINGLASSHDLHLLAIDQREDKLISRIRNWLSRLMDDLVSSEIQRNRNTVTEINHFLDLQKAELSEITSTPLGLLLLPKDIQDALKIS